MKKILFLLLIFVSAMQVSRAQVYDIDIPGNIVLTDNQWHLDGYSVVEANDNIYLVITPNSCTYYTLRPISEIVSGKLARDIIFSCDPYLYDNTLGWVVRTRSAYYFVYPDGVYVLLKYRPTYYDYYFTFHHLRHLNMRDYYWHRPHYAPRPRPIDRHRPFYSPGPRRSPNYARPPRQNPPRQNPPRHQNPPTTRPGQGQPQRDGIQNRPPQRQNGNAAPNRPPQRQNGNAAPSRPPQRQNGNMQNRPPQRSGSGSQSRPPQRSGGSSSRRR